MKDFIKKRLRSIKREKNNCKKDNLLDDFAYLTMSAISIGMGVLGGLAVSPILGAGLVCTGVSGFLIPYKAKKTKEKNKINALQREEDNLNKISSNGGVSLDKSSKKKRKLALDDTCEDLKDAVAEHKRSKEISDFLELGLAVSMFPLIFATGPLSLSVLGGCAIGKIMADKKEQDNKLKVDNLISKVNILEDETKIADLNTNTQTEEQIQEQQPRHTRSKRKTRNNTRKRNQGAAINTSDRFNQESVSDFITTGYNQDNATPTENNNSNTNIIEAFINSLDNRDELSMLHYNFERDKAALEDKATKSLEELINRYYDGSIGLSQYYKEVSKIYSNLERDITNLQLEYFKAARELEKQKSNQYTLAA